MKGGPQRRVSSPWPGRSILITSAPRSARFCVAHGPASTRVRSRTRTPSRMRDKVAPIIGCGQPALTAASFTNVETARLSLRMLGSMATKVLTHELRIGMFVADLDRPWVDTPFLLQGFLIENEEQIHALQTHCEWVMIDRARSTGAEFEAVAGISPATNTAPQRRPAVRINTNPSGIDPEAATPLSAPIEEK